MSVEQYNVEISDWNVLKKEADYSEIVSAF